ncbi:MAG: hypothetical protein ACREDO_07710 [Methyloceanibacter sp.]
MPLWSKVAGGLVIAIALIGFAGFKAYSEKLGPLVQEYGTTYYNGQGPASAYNGQGPASAPVACKPRTEILAAIAQVRAKYDHLAGDSLVSFEQRAAALKGLPPLDVEELYVITEDEELRSGEMVVFIGIRANCVTMVFGLPARTYHELIGRAPARAAKDPTS